MRLRSVEVQGVAHVSLPEFIDQCGGYCRVEPARVNADVLGRSLVLPVNDNRVYTSRDQFSLAHPIIRHRGEVLVALEDLATLAGRGFNATLRQQDALDTETDDALDTPPPAPATAAAADTPPPAPDTAAAADTAPLPAQASPAPLNARGTGLVSVVIDAGHGGTDPGYVSAGGVAEKDLALAVALALRDVLKETTPIKLYTTRAEDEALTPRDRALRAQQAQADLFVSIHAGVALSDTAEGIGVYYASPPAGARSSARRPGLAALDRPRDYSAQSRRAALAIADGLATVAASPSVWVREAPVGVLREAGMPAVLVEVGHLTNPAEAALLESRSQQQKVAQGIAEGVKALAVGTTGDAP